MTPSFFQTCPRACAVVLASSKGSRLFPITTPNHPKHLLPVAGVPCILRLLEANGPLSSYSQIVIAVSAEDDKTVPILLGNERDDTVQDEPSETFKAAAIATQTSQSESQWNLTSNAVNGQTIHVIRLAEDCFGPIDALRQIENTKLIHPKTRIVVFPGDLVFLKFPDGANSLDALIRPPSDSACVSVLVDVLEQDEHNNTLKESAKAKKGGLSREDEAIEYIALSFPSKEWTDQIYRTHSRLPQILLKKSKKKMEADEDMTGSSAKITLSKARLRPGNLVIRTEWSDLHVYSFAPWVRQLILSRNKNLSSIQEDLLPLLISRQHRGKSATFGKSGLEALAASSQDSKENAVDSKFGEHSSNSPSESPSNEKRDWMAAKTRDEAYAIHSLLLPSKSALRSNTIAAYLFACKEAVTSGESKPEGSKWNEKFQTLILAGSTVGAKITMKSCTVGDSCFLGDKCRLNNVVIMDNVTIGEGCSLQNTIIGYGAKLGDNCSLNDCQVGPGMNIPSGTKEKGESFMVGDAIEDMLL